MLSAKRKTYYAHRISYEMHRGDVPDGMQVLHTCDNPTCSNPKHLFLGTPKENMRDRSAKGRTAVGESHGAHKLSVEQAMEIHSSIGVTNRKLADAYGVSPTQICLIRQGKRWSSLQ